MKEVLFVVVVLMQTVVSKKSGINSLMRRNEEEIRKNLEHIFTPKTIGLLSNKDINKAIAQPFGKSVFSFKLSLILSIFI